MGVLDYNRRAWDEAVRTQSEWTIPVSHQAVAAARAGEWQIVLTPTKAVPRAWFPTDLTSVRVLCLASGGGQQGPILAAAGAIVTVFDNSPRQLAQDRMVAEREGLSLRLEQGDMADLSRFPAGSFDLIVHPVSNVFVPAVRPVWQEAFRVLSKGGELLAGFCNPAMFIFDAAKADKGLLEVRHTIPYSDLTHLTAEERRRYVDDLQPLEWGHSLDDQIGGQLDAGFVLVGFYEDVWPGQALSDYMPHYIATRARKL
jgi:SAM-dependent methyltransferase